MKSEREAVTANSGLVAARPVYPESWCPAPGRGPWQGPQADLIPSCCRMLVGLGSDSGCAVTADAGLQKPAERGAHRLRQSQLVPFTPKARRPATRAIAAKKQRGRQSKRPRPRVFPGLDPTAQSLAPGPAHKVLPCVPLLEPAPCSPAPPPGAPPPTRGGGGTGPAHRNRSLEIRPVLAVCLV